MDFKFKTKDEVNLYVESIDTNIAYRKESVKKGSRWFNISIIALIIVGLCIIFWSVKALPINIIIPIMTIFIIISIFTCFKFCKFNHIYIYDNERSPSRDCINTLIEVIALDPQTLTNTNAMKFGIETPVMQSAMAFDILQSNINKRRLELENEVLEYGEFYKI